MASICCGTHYKTKRGFDNHVAAKHQGVPPSSNVKVEELLKCSICDKPYKTLRGLNKHKLIHVQAGEVNLPVDSNVNCFNPIAEEEEIDDDMPEDADVGTVESEARTFFEEEDEQQEALLLAALLGTEVALQSERSSTTEGAKNVPKTPLALCSTCGKGFMTLLGLLKHRISHATAEAVAKAPSLDDVKAEADRMANEVLDDILSLYPEEKKLLRLCSTQMKDNIHTHGISKFLASLCVGLYACFASGSQFLLPSHLREAYVRGAAVLMANKDKREELKLKLLSVLDGPISDNNIDFFLTTFMRRFSNKVLAFIVHWMVHGAGSPIVISASKYRKSTEAIDTKAFKETLHYVAGANVKSILRCAWRKWGSNDDCKSVIKVVRDRFLIQQDREMDVKEYMSWTLSQDRGRLIKVNDDAFNFFFELASIVRPLERIDGSLFVQDVLDKFVGHPKILYLWEVLIQDNLSGPVSFKLLHSLTTYFCNTWRSGILSRRMDNIQSSKEAQSQGTGGVAFRSHLASR